jgi:hypothetical protein
MLGAVLIVRDQQMQALAKPKLDELAARIAAFLRGEEATARVAPEGEVEASVSASVERGVEIGLRSERELALFAAAGWLAGPGLEAAHPELMRVLGSPTLSPLEKAQHLTTLIDDLPAREAD